MMLPPGYISAQLFVGKDQRMLKSFSGKRLLKIAAIENEKERQNKIERLLPKA